MSTRYPLSLQQEWLWGVIRDNERWHCRPVSVFRLPGVLNVSLLQLCFQEVIQRHGALRTRIVAFDGSVWQEIRDSAECVLEGLTVEGASDALITSNARRYVEDFCDQRMAPAFGPLWEARLLKLSEHEHWLVLAMHRLVGDCASIDQVHRELKSLYEERLQGRPSALNPPTQYADYTAWQHQTSEEWVKRHEPYWKQRLAGSAPLRWQTDADLTASTPGILGKVDCSFGRTLSTGVLELARAARTLAAVPMLAIYATVLWWQCRQTDFVLPFNTAGRPTAYKYTIGYFSYALYLRIHITGEETFRDLVSRIGNEFFSSLAHQDFGRLAVQRPELLSGTVFQWLTLHREDAEERVAVRDFGNGLTVVPPGMTAAEVTVFDTATGLHAFGSYRTDIFTVDTMGRFMTNLRWAADFFVHNPDARIAAVTEAGGDVHGTAERSGPDVQRGVEPVGGEARGGVLL